MTKKLAALLLAILSGNLLLPAQTLTPAWKEYVYPEDGFAIALPSAPTLHKDLDKPNMMYSVHPTSDIVVNLTVVREVEDCAATVASFKEEALKTGDPSSVKDFSASGYAGFERESNGPQGDKLYGRYFCANGKFYFLGASWPVDDPKPSVVPRIVESFRLLNPSPHNSPDQPSTKAPPAKQK